MSRLHREPMRALIEEIVEGDPPPGRMLPKEVDLVDRFGVSRGVVREFLRGLEERGLVAVKHGRGATVRDPADWDVFDPAVLAALVVAPGGKQLRAEALECQRLIEQEAAALAASRATGEHVDELERALETMTATASRAGRSESAAQAYRDAHLDFHRAVVRAAGNRMLARMSEPLHHALAAAGAEGGDRKRRLAEHQRILTAIAGGDADGARDAMAEHLAAGARRRRG
jgi:DNA-binding FadR family transcriptional regulator